MSQITIYFGDKPVFLCDEITREIDEYMHHPDAVYMDEISNAAIHSLLHEINKAQFHAGILFDTDFRKLKTAFFKHFTLMQAAGGLVKNQNNEVLLMMRRQVWDLPKGKLDEGESLEACALREVREETGLGELELEGPLEITYHTYVQFGKSILKETHWYKMKATGNELPVPQAEEDITEIVWAKEADLPRYLSNTFPAIARLLKNV